MADLYSILADGRPKSYIADLDPRFAAALSSMIDAAPEDVRNQLRIMSGARSNQRQAELYDAALKKYGSPEAARKWVAPPGRSRHNTGVASDLTYLSPAAKQWAHENATIYGLDFPMSHEPWHIELAGARDGPAQNTAATPQASLLGADARQAAQQQQAAMQTPAQPPAVTQATQSPIGNMLSGMMGAFSAPGAMPSAPVVKKDDSAALEMAAQALSEKGKKLKTQFLPDVDAILGISKPGGVVI